MMMRCCYERAIEARYYAATNADARSRWCHIWCLRCDMRDIARFRATAALLRDADGYAARKTWLLFIFIIFDTLAITLRYYYYYCCHIHIHIIFDAGAFRFRFLLHGGATLMALLIFFILLMLFHASARHTPIAYMAKIRRWCRLEPYGIYSLSLILYWEHGYYAFHYNTIRQLSPLPRHYADITLFDDIIIIDAAMKMNDDDDDKMIYIILHIETYMRRLPRCHYATYYLYSAKDTYAGYHYFYLRHYLPPLYIYAITHYHETLLHITYHYICCAMPYSARYFHFHAMMISHAIMLLRHYDDITSTYIHTHYIRIISALTPYAAAIIDAIIAIDSLFSVEGFICHTRWYRYKH